MRPPRERCRTGSVGGGSAVQRIAERGAAGRLDSPGAGRAIRAVRGHPGRRRQPGRHLGADAVAAAVQDPRVHGLRLGRNVGQTAAMMAGFDHARGRVVVSLDGDLQNDPRDIPALVAKLDEGYDLVCGWRQRRQDKCPAAEGAVVGGQPDHPAADGRPDHRQRLLAQGLSAGPAGPDLPVRRAASVHSGLVGQRRGAHHRDAGAASRPPLRREQVRHLPNGEGAGGPVHAEDDHHLPVPAAARVRQRRRCRWCSARCCSRWPPR